MMTPVVMLQLSILSSLIMIGTSQVSIDQDGIIGADIFTSRLEILSASIGFDGTVGVGQTEEVAREFGLAWDFDIEALDVCPVTGEDASDITRIGGIASTVNITYDCDKDPDRFDGFPMCFSWPMLPCSVQREHILYTRSDGATFNPSCISTVPNNEFNERHCLVMFDDFINRQLPGEAGRLAMDKIEIVGDLLFVGPKGELVFLGWLHQMKLPTNRDHSLLDPGSHILILLEKDLLLATLQLVRHLILASIYLVAIVRMGISTVCACTIREG